MPSRRDQTRKPDTANAETGAIGYVLLWLLGVPGSILFLIFILRGCT